MSATHKDLEALSKRGEFRQDLFYRINVIELRVPPLRERADDIPLLVDYILARLSADVSEFKPAISPAALKVLGEYRFPGNVRELENILERAMTLCEGNRIEVADLNLPFPEASPSEKVGREEAQPLEPYLDAVERQRILDALEKTRWNKTAAAKLLGISFRALRYRLAKLGVE